MPKEIKIQLGMEIIYQIIISHKVQYAGPIVGYLQIN